MKEGEETGAEGEAASIRQPTGATTSVPAAEAGDAKPTLGERRGLAPGTLRVNTGADGA